MSRARAKARDTARARAVAMARATARARARATARARTHVYIARTHVYIARTHVYIARTHVYIQVLTATYTLHASGSNEGNASHTTRPGSGPCNKPCFGSTQQALLRVHAAYALALTRI